MTSTCTGWRMCVCLLSAATQFCKRRGEERLSGCCVSVYLLSGSTRTVIIRQQSPEEVETHETHTSARVIQRAFLPQEESQDSPASTPSVQGWGKGCEMEMGRFDLSEKRKLLFSFKKRWQLDSCISWVDKTLYVLFLYIYSHLFICCSVFVCVQYLCVHRNVMSAAKEVVGAVFVFRVFGWLSILFTEVVVGAQNSASPSESQCASLAAAISALVSLLITSFDHLCAITWI